MVISAPVIEAGKEDIIALNQLSCIYYLIWFKKNKV